MINAGRQQQGDATTARFSPFYGNTGFFYLRHSNLVRAFWHRVLTSMDMIHRLNNDIFSFLLVFCFYFLKKKNKKSESIWKDQIVLILLYSAQSQQNPVNLYAGFMHRYFPPLSRYWLSSRTFIRFAQKEKSNKQPRSFCSSSFARVDCWRRNVVASSLARTGKTIHKRMVI